VQGVAHHEVLEVGGTVGGIRGQEQAATGGVVEQPAAGVGVGEKGAGEIRSLREGASGGGGAVRRLGVVEGERVERSETFPVEESNDGLPVEGPVAAKEADNAEEGCAGGGRTGEVGRRVEVEEDLT
jgi:hypothetical protein